MKDRIEMKKSTDGRFQHPAKVSTAAPALPFRHEQGFHCGTTALRGLMRHFGHELSENMCLGLGMAPNFFYLHDSDFKPKNFFQVRSAFMEEDFFRVLGIDAPVVQYDDPKDSWEPVRSRIDEGHPVLLQVDIRHLPYYNTTTHFPGHKVILAGYNAESGEVFLSDSEYPEIQVITIDQLQRARWYPKPPLVLCCQWWDISAIPGIAPLAEAVPQALTGCARRVLQGEMEFFGVPAMDHMAATLARWGRSEDWAWSARFGYQVIERRGTGGGAFRRKYAEFLSEAVDYDPRVRRFDLPRRMMEISLRWTAFAEVLKVISQGKAPRGFDEAAEAFSQIAGLERAFFEDLLP